MTKPNGRGICEMRAEEVVLLSAPFTENPQTKGFYLMVDKKGDTMV